MIRALCFFLLALLALVGCAATVATGGTGGGDPSTSSSGGGEPTTSSTTPDACASSADCSPGEFCCFNPAVDALGACRPHHTSCPGGGA